MSIARPSSIAALLLALAACGASEPPPSGANQSSAEVVPAPEVKAAGDAPDPHATCVAFFRRQRDCTDDYIPALVDARVRADHPAGIAAKDREMGRDALVAAAREEWAADSTDQAIAATCDQLAAQAAPELVDRAQACLAEGECPAFSRCAVEVAASRW